MTKESLLKSIVFNLTYCPNMVAWFRDENLRQYKEMTGEEWRPNSD